MNDQTSGMMSYPNFDGDSKIFKSAGRSSARGEPLSRKPFLGERPHRVLSTALCDTFKFEIVFVLLKTLL